MDDHRCCFCPASIDFTSVAPILILNFCWDKISAVHGASNVNTIIDYIPTPTDTVAQPAQFPRARASKPSLISCTMPQLVSI